MKIEILFFLISSFMMQQPFAQNSGGIERLPVNIAPATNDTSNPMVMYITGDGGWNKFSKTLSQAFADRGYPVVSLNAKDYFWKKKTPLQTATDIALLIRSYERRWNRKKIVLVGYSFGADVLPFVYNLLPADISTRVVNLSFLSPSANTDFEIHISVLLGAGFSGGESVVGAINKITSKQLTLVFGKEENSFPLNQLKIKNYTTIRLDGGHHYDGDEVKVCNAIIQHLQKK